MHSHIFNQRNFGVATGIVLVSCLILAGCGKKEEGKVIQQGDGITVEQKGDTASITTTQGSAEYKAGANVEMPKDFPTDVPTYPGMQLEFAGKAGPMFTINGKSAEAMAKVSDSLKSEVEKQGWSQVMSMNQSAANGQPGMMTSYTKKNRVLNVVLASEGQGTRISIMTGSQ
jgi:hypothetical protein